MDATQPTPDAEQARLRAEVEAVTRELNALPLINDNKKVRLTLNQRKRDAEEALARLEREAARAALGARIAALNEELRSIGEAPQSRARRVELRRALAELRIELEGLGR